MTKNPTLLNYYFVGCGPKIQLTDKNDDTITSDTNKGLKRVHRSVGGIGKLQQIHSFWRDQQRWALRKMVRELRKCAICVAHYAFFSALAQFALRSMPVFSALAQFALRSMPFFSALAQFAFANR